MGLKDGSKKKHKSHDDKNCSRHSSADKPPSSSSHKASANLNANRLGTAMAQACFSAARMTKVVEDNHNSKIADALLTKQCLEKASAEAVESMMDDIWGVCTPADMWWIEKRISTCISLQRAKAYEALVDQYRPEFKPHQDKEGSEGISTGAAEAEEQFHKSMMDLISAILMEGGKVPGGHRVALASNVLWLMPTLPLNPVFMTCVDLPSEKECRIMSGEMPRSLSSRPSTPSLLPSSPLTGSTGGLSLGMRSTIRFGQAVIWPVTHMSQVVDFGFFKKPLPAEVPAPLTGWKSPGASSTPQARPPLQSSGEDLDKTDPTVDLMGCEDDKLFAQCKESSSKSKEVHGSLKRWGSSPAKRARMDSSGSHNGSKSKSWKSSCASQDKWGGHETSTKEPKYKKMRYLTFTPMTDLEQELL